MFSTHVRNLFSFYDYGLSYHYSDIGTKMLINTIFILFKRKAPYVFVYPGLWNRWSHI